MYTKHLHFDTRFIYMTVANSRAHVIHCSDLRSDTIHLENYGLNQSEV